MNRFWPIRRDLAILSCEASAFSDDVAWSSGVTLAELRRIDIHCWHVRARCTVMIGNGQGAAVLDGPGQNAGLQEVASHGREDSEMA
jgi:hypothetical protein